MSTAIASVGGSTSAAGAPPPNPTDEAARTLVAQNTRFGAVDVKAVAQGIADAPGDKAALSASVARGLDARDQATLVSEFTVIVHKPAAPAATDDRPHGLLDHLKDAGGVVWGAAKDLGHLAAGVGRTATDLTLGGAVDAAREAAGLVTGHTPEAPYWAPSAERGVASLETAGKTAWTAATHPGAVIDALKAPYQKDVAEGRWGALAAQTVLDFGGLLDGESEALVGARVAAKSGEIASDVSEVADLSKAADASKAGDAAKVAERALALTRVTAKVGKNEAEWLVNAQGRGVESRAVLRESFDNIERESSETNLTEEVGKSGGRTDDDGGHIIAHRFMKTEGEKNMFPQNANFNRGAYKTMENEWAAWTKAGGEVHVDVHLEEFKGARPAQVEVSYQVVNSKTGEEVYRTQKVFNNEAGERFERLSAADIAKRMGAN